MTQVAKPAEWRDTKSALLDQLKTRQAEIEPFITEYNELEDQIAILDPAAPRPVRRRFSTAGTRRVARGEHDNRFLGIVALHPEGIKIPDIVQAYKDKGWELTNAGQYLYKVAERNVERGHVRKDEDHRYHVVDGFATPVEQQEQEPAAV